MSGVLHEFDAQNIKISESDRTIYIVSGDGQNLVFKYDIHCKVSKEAWLIPIAFLFNTKTRTYLIIHRPTTHFAQSKGEHHCVIGRFNIIGDVPVLGVNYFTNQDRLILHILEDFRSQYAVILIDDAINS